MVESRDGSMAMTSAPSTASTTIDPRRPVGLEVERLVAGAEQGDPVPTGRGEVDDDRRALVELLALRLAGGDAVGREERLGQQPGG